MLWQGIPIDEGVMCAVQDIVDSDQWARRHVKESVDKRVAVAA